MSGESGSLTRQSTPPDPPSGHIDYDVSIAGKDADPLFTAKGSLATWDWLAPHEALAAIFGMLDAGDTAALNASQGDVSLWPSDTRITATLAYRDE